MSSRKEQKAAVREERAAKEHAAASAAKRKQRFWQLGGITVIAVVIVAVLIVLSQGGAEKSSPNSKTISKSAVKVNALFSGIPQSGSTIGDPKAPITVVEYGDPQCPVCAEFSELTIPTLVKDYVRTGKVRLEYRPLTFLDDSFGVTDSNRAANFFLETGKQDKLWQTVDLFYANQGDEGSGYVTDDFLLKVGNEVKGLDAQKAVDESADDPFAEQLATISSQSQADGVKGTPAFVIGKTGQQGKLWEYKTFDPQAFSAKLDQELKQAGK